MPAYPETPRTEPPIVKGSTAQPSVHDRTDPRIAYAGPANRAVLDALKQVKRADTKKPLRRADEGAQSPADVLARDTLQVALRMEQAGRFDEAIRFLERSIAQSPDAAALYNRLGIILMRERADLSRAEKMFRKALELAPDHTVYEANLRQVVARQALRAQ
jgi:tetratricopeptide (TPR) repeat protein